MSISVKESEKTTCFEYAPKISILKRSLYYLSSLSLIYVIFALLNTIFIHISHGFDESWYTSTCSLATHMNNADAFQNAQCMMYIGNSWKIFMILTVITCCVFVYFYAVPIYGKSLISPAWCPPATLSHTLTSHCISVVQRAWPCIPTAIWICIVDSWEEAMTMCEFLYIALRALP